MAKKQTAGKELRAASKCVMAIAAHPDDIEFTMAGTLLALQARGWEVHYLNISNGNVGSMTQSLTETAKTRLGEAKAACKAVGFKHHAPIVDDLCIAYEKKQFARVTSAIRAARPSIVLTQSPQDYAEDHQNATRLAVTGAFCKSMKNAPCVPARAPYFGDVAVYHAMPHGLRDGMGKLLHAGLWVDVAKYVDAKKEMLGCHKSQKEWLDATQGMDSYLQTMVDLCRAMGKMSGKYTLAEGWRRHNALGFAADLGWDPLAEALADVSHLDKKYAAWLNE